MIPFGAISVRMTAIGVVPALVEGVLQRRRI
jgi:hypothetical protein